MQERPPPGCPCSWFRHTGAGGGDGTHCERCGVRCAASTPLPPPHLPRSPRPRDTRTGVHACLVVLPPSTSAAAFCCRPSPRVLLRLASKVRGDFEPRGHRREAMLRPRLEYGDPPPAESAQVPLLTVGCGRCEGRRLRELASDRTLTTSSHAYTEGRALARTRACRVSAYADRLGTAAGGGGAARRRSEEEAPRRRLRMQGRCRR